METKKLTAEDLMVGDYVYRPDCYDKVVEVRKDTILGSDPLRGLIPIADLQPIPLTSEILEKNGFIKYLWDIYRLPKTDFSIEHTGGLFILRISNERLCEIKSVSHLQHLLRDFGIEGDCAMSEYRIHPVFGKLTDPEEIAIFDRQQAEEDMEKAYLEDQQKAEYEAEMRAYEEAYQQAEYEYYWMLFMQENEMITD